MRGSMLTRLVEGMAGGPSPPLRPACPRKSAYYQLFPEPLTVIAVDWLMKRPDGNVPFTVLLLNVTAPDAVDLICTP